MEFMIEKGPHIKDQDTTSKIMKRLLIALIPIIIFSIYKNGIMLYQTGSATFYQALRPLIMILLSVFTSVLIEGLFIWFILKKQKKQFKEYFKHSYAVFPGLFLVLVLPINTPLWAVVFGSIIATIIGKMLFGGFGHNIFNPALIGALFVTSSYGALIASRGGYLNLGEIDTVSSATPLTHLSNLNHIGTYDTIINEFGSWWNYFLGFIPGAIGETSKLLILIALIYLILTKVIKWQIPVIYISTVFVMTLIIGLYNDMGWWYPLMHILSGGLMFGAVFMATDPVTSPISKIGQVYYGLGLGILTVIFRFLTSYPEGVLTAILTMNMLVIIIDRLGAAVRFDLRKALLPFSLILLIGLSISFYTAYAIQPKEEGDDRVTILDINQINDNTIYHVTTKGFGGLIEAKIIFQNDKITKIDILNQNESYWLEINNNNYLNDLINEQDQISEVDIVSGATKTSTALKLMVERVLEENEKD
jgi:electron transport complex protein RnfD